MGKKKIWFITGAGRGMGVDFAKAALAAGHGVVATGRDTASVSRALGQSDDLLVAKLDVTNRADTEAAVLAAIHRFGRIRCSRKQRRQFLRRLFRRADARSVRTTARNELVRFDERYPRCPASHAQTALGTPRRDLLLRWARRLRVL